MARSRYGPEHRRLRRRWAKIVDAGEAWCHEPECVKGNRWIKPGTKWHLSHAPDGSWRGPSHWQCNESEMNKRVNSKPEPQQAWSPTERW